MQLFSTRYSASRLRRTYSESENGSFLKETLRNRLTYEIRYIVEKTDMLESFLTLKDENDDTKRLRAISLRDISMSSAGYDISLSVNTSTYECGEDDQNDLVRMDLLEICIIFAKEEYRDEVVKRFQEIFSEEGGRFMIHNYMIIVGDETSIRSLAPLIKNKTLNKKLVELLGPSGMGTSQTVRARQSADMVQLIYSGAGKGDTKAESEKLCRKIADKWTEPAKSDDLYDLLNKIVLLAKELSNQISNIRHTDQSTIIVDNPSLYKLIHNLNMGIVELTVFSLPEDFVINQKAPEVKTTYLERYGVDKDAEYTIRARPTIPQVNLDDIPF